MATTYTVRNDQGQSFQVDEDKLSLAAKDGYLPVVSNGQEEHRVDPESMHLAVKDGYKPIGAEPTGPSFGQKVAAGAKAVARGLDYATGAPVRAGIGALQHGESPIMAFIKQYGKAPETAPTGEQIATDAGVPNVDKTYRSAEPAPNDPDFYRFNNDPTFREQYLKDGKGSDYTFNPAKMAGTGVEMGANLLNVVPGMGLAQKAAARTAEAVSDVSPILKTAAQKATGILDAVAEAPGKVGTKVASEVTGVPKKAIGVYAERGDEVKDLLTKTGGELPVAADEMKGKVLESIAQTKKGLNDQITQALSQNPTRVPTQPIIEKLEAAKAKLNPHYNPSDIAQIDEMIDAVKNTAAPDGSMSLQDLFDTKKFLQTRGQGAYVKEGQLFSSGAEAQKAAKGAGGVARETLHGADKSIEHADAVFEHLHDLDDKMSASLLGQGKPETVFASAGGGKGNIYQVQLKDVGKTTGTNPIKDAELLYAAKQFKDPNLRTTALKGFLDMKRATFDAVPTGTSAAIDDVLGLVNHNSTPLVPAYADRSAIDRRTSALKR